MSMGKCLIIDGDAFYRRISYYPVTNLHPNFTQVDLIYLWKITSVTEPLLKAH
jgi:hypothetical protein